MSLKIHFNIMHFDEHIFVEYNTTFLNCNEIVFTEI